MLFQLEAFRTYGEWPDKQGVRISGGPHLGVHCKEIGTLESKLFSVVDDTEESCSS